MRLTKIRLAGFKSFVDPTQISFPSNLTGVVGPNGCGKSNVIDAVRWVMGELSAKHLRGDNMADVMFNGSGARKPVGTAIVELMFDNADGKIGGAYASYAEISLKRAGDPRRHLGLLHQRRALPPQGHHQAVPRHRPRVAQLRDHRAGHDHPRDRRPQPKTCAPSSRRPPASRVTRSAASETEARIGETRENLERLQDLRDEVEKQIRHLQRQAATARRYQALKDSERRLTAELLALQAARPR